MASAASGAREHREGYPDIMRIAELYRLVSNLVRRGKVVKVDYGAMKVRVGVGNPKNRKNYFESEWLPWMVPASSNNRVWCAPEVGEQVLILSESGNPANGVVLRGIPYAATPSDANSPDLYKETFREPADFDTATNSITGEAKPVVGFREYNRVTGYNRFWVRPEGQHRWDVGDAASIILTKDRVELRIQQTYIVITAQSIRLSVEGNNTEIALTLSGIVLHVLGMGVVTITKSVIAAFVKNAWQTIWSSGGAVTGPTTAQYAPTAPIEPEAPVAPATGNKPSRPTS